MKIAHIARTFSRSAWGGTETVVANLVREQRHRGADARVFATRALWSGVEDSSDDATYYPYLYPYIPLPRADRLALDHKGGSPYAPSLFRAVRKFRPDVIHVHCGGRLAQAAVQCARRLGIPSVISLHGGCAEVPKAELDEMLRPLRGKFPWGGIVDRFVGLRFDPVAEADAVLAISKSEVEKLRARLPGHLINYLPNGVPEFVPTTCPRERGSRKIVCVSRIDYQKNQLALVDLLAARPEVTVTLVGGVTAAWYRDRILARVDELGVADRFRLVPGLPPGSAELEAAFTEADAFILPSVHEPFGIVALEALQRGVPLIAANVGGIPDFVRDGENGLLFDPGRAGALLQVWDRFVSESSSVRAARVIAGVETASRYRWSRIVADLSEIYERVS